MNANLLTADTSGRIDPSEFELSFSTQYGSPIRYYDDGIGTLFIMRDSMGIVGIVRAQSLEDAYSIVEDESLPVVPADEVHEAYGAYDKLHDHMRSKGHEENVEMRRFAIEWAPVYFQVLVAQESDLELEEGYSYQSNSTGTGIVSHDLNGESLEPLTIALLERLEIVVTIKFAS